MTADNSYTMDIGTRYCCGQGGGGAEGGCGHSYELQKALRRLGHLSFVLKSIYSGRHSREREICMHRPEATWQEQDMAVGMLCRKGVLWRKLMNHS